MQATLRDCSDSLVLKTTGKCNLRCDYCYEEKHQSCSRTDLSLSLVEDTLRDYADSIRRECPSQKAIFVIWHGGEPLLRGLPFFQNVLHIEETLAQRFSLAFHNGIQTNGTLIDRTWANFFRDNLFEVGMSLDGPESVNRLHRHQFKQAYAGLRLLSSVGIRPKVIVVVSDKNCRYVQDVHSFFMNEPVAYVDFVPCYMNNGRHSLHPDHYQSFMIELFDMWIRDEKPYRIRLFDDIIRKMNGTVLPNDPITCSLTGQCGAILSITSEGDVYYCDCLPKTAEFRVGDIQQGVIAIRTSNAYLSLRNRNQTKPQRCGDCDFYPICGGGCINRRLNPRNTESGVDYYCSSRKVLLGHIAENIGIKPPFPHTTGIPAFTRAPQPENWSVN